MGHEVARHCGQRSQAVGADHLLDGGAAFGQILQKGQPFVRTGVERVIEAGLPPDLLRFHPLTRSRQVWQPTAAVPFP